MRWASLLFCYLFLAFTFAGAGAPLLAADLGKSPGRTYPDNRSNFDKALPGRDVAEFCYTQGQICRKICDLHSNFDDEFDGCPQSCDSRAFRCTRTGCFRWTEPDFLIAERFGGFKCNL
jgi:hypothetical protein